MSFFGFLLSAISFFPASLHADGVRADFVDVQNLIPNAQIHMLYARPWNFTGHKVPGYEANRCLLTQAAAQALAKAEADLEKLGLMLWITDCYRPKRAVEDFVSWSKNATDLKMKSQFYPAEAKETLFQRGYIASRSGHSRGSTIDLTVAKLTGITKDKKMLDANATALENFEKNLVDCRKPNGIEKTGQLDMGTAVDCLDEKAHTDSRDISPKAHENRMTLKQAMETAGFENYSKEWWHYTLKAEPHPNEYYDFVVN